MGARRYLGAARGITAGCSGHPDAGVAETTSLTLQNQMRVIQSEGSGVNGWSARPARGPDGTGTAVIAPFVAVRIIEDAGAAATAPRVQIGAPT